MANPEHLEIVKQGAEAIRKWREKQFSVAPLDVSGADLCAADLREAELYEALLHGSRLDGASFQGAEFWGTMFANVDLSSAKGLEDVRHLGPSTLGVDTLRASKGGIPEAFLRGCGLLPWEILDARLHDPTLSAGEIADLQCKIFEERAKGWFLGGLFISYAHEDRKLVDKLRQRLLQHKVAVWLDGHDAVAGPLERQVFDAIRLNDVFLVVLSAASVESDWVEAELEQARRKEKQENRDFLCPVALDESWKVKADRHVLWRQVKQKNVLDFSRWKTRAFEEPFGKLVRGLRRYYGPRAGAR